MKVSVKQINSTFKWHYRVEGNSTGYPLLWLHGFMGSGLDWVEFVHQYFNDYNNILLDLPGHGGSALPASLDFSTILDSLLIQLETMEIQDFIPIGYSMGGRLGFHIYDLAPEQIKGLVFLSSAPGLKTRDARKMRQTDDDRLMDRLEEMGFESFLKDWYSAPLFGDLKSNPRLFEYLCQARSDNDITQIRRSLELMGNGALPSLWSKLNSIAVPTLLVSGGLDAKYDALNGEMNLLMPGSQHYPVKDAGHAFHLEKPLETARIIRHFLRETIKGD